MDPITIGAIISGVSALAQSGFGAAQAASGNKQFKKLLANRPNYDIPQEYKDILARYQQAQAGDMPGYQQTLSNIGQAGARARGAAERGAISSASYGAQLGNLYQKELDAIQNLGVQQEQYKTSMLDKVAQAQGTLGAQKSEQWNLNQFLPWQTEMNRLGEKKQAGIQNLFSGLQSGIGNLSDLAGTSYYKKMLESLQKTGTTTATPSMSGATINPNLFDITKPLGQ